MDAPRTHWPTVLTALNLGLALALPLGLAFGRTQASLESVLGLAWKASVMVWFCAAPITTVVGAVLSGRQHRRGLAGSNLALLVLWVVEIAALLVRV